MDGMKKYIKHLEKYVTQTSDYVEKYACNFE